MKYSLSIAICLIVSMLTGCFQGEKVDLIIHNAQIYSMNANNDVYQAMAINDGKIIELGPERQILNKYKAVKTIDAKGKDILPSFTDAHGHIMGLANQKLSVDLFGVKSYEELILRTEKFQRKKHKKFIVGRGWDQSIWKTSNMPNNNLLSEKFPDVPVVLYRVDGHALLANDAALRLAGIDSSSKVNGGIVEMSGEKPTGILIDNEIGRAHV